MLLLIHCTISTSSTLLSANNKNDYEIESNNQPLKSDSLNQPRYGGELATFGAGCFWGTEKFFKKQFKDGLHFTAVGYSGGRTLQPTYEEVCDGETGHAEVLHLEYDPNKVKYEDLVEFFFRMHDPTTLNRQGNDRGTQYRSVIFFHSKQQQDIAKQVRDRIQAKFYAPIVTEISPFTHYYDGEDYHQQYLDKNPMGLSLIHI